MKVTIADSLFLQHANSAKLGGPNKDIYPTYFEWEHADPHTARFVTDSDIKNATGRGQVALLLETFFLHPENYLAAMEKHFDFVLTHNLYFATHKNWLWYPHGGSFVAFDDWGVKRKTKLVSLLCSPKAQLRGHKLFHEIAERFSSRVDVYGIESYATKMEALADYRFSIVVEAEESESFFSEKLIDCFALGTMPIYWGCPNIAQFFNTNGMLRISSIKQLEHILNILNVKLYEQNKNAVMLNFEKAIGYRLPEDWIYKNYPYLFEDVMQ